MSIMRRVWLLYRPAVPARPRARHGPHWADAVILVYFKLELEFISFISIIINLGTPDVIWS